MRVTIIPGDGAVYVEGHALTVDCSFMPEDIHAVQWYGAAGEIEYKTDFVNMTRKPNEIITDFAPFLQAVDLWEIEAQKEPPPAPSAPTTTPAETPVHVIAN